MKDLKYRIHFNVEFDEKKYNEAKKIILSLFPKATIEREIDDIGIIEYAVGNEKIRIDNDGYLNEVRISSSFDLKLKGYKTYPIKA